MSLIISSSIDNYIKHLEKGQHASFLTVRNYSHYLNRFREFLDNHFPTLVTPEEISPSVLQQYTVYISKFVDKKGISLDLNTQAYHLIALRSFLKYLILTGRRMVSPEAVSIPRVKAKEIIFLDTNQVEKIIRLAENVRDRSIIELLLSTGLRVSDLVKLDRKSINFSNKQIYIVNSSGQKRTVFLSGSCAYWLDKYLQERKDDSDALFIRTAGRKEGTLRLTARSIQRIIEKYVKKAGLTIKATPHSLRHTFAISLLSGGTSLPAVKNILGHKNISTTQIYTHVTNPQLKEIHQKFHHH